MNPNELANFLGSLVEDNSLHDRQVLLERSHTLVLKCSIATAEIRTKLLTLTNEVPNYINAIGVVIDDTDIELSADHRTGATPLYQITINKRQVEDQICLFFGLSIQSIEGAIESVSSLRIADLPDGGTFTTERTRVCKWVLDVAPNHSCLEPLADPRKFSRDFTSRACVPQDVRPWLLRTRPEIESDAFKAFKIISARKLIAVLANEVIIENDLCHYSFSGPPLRKFHIEDEKLNVLYERMLESVRWVFVDVRDPDVRHLFMSSEWARSYDSDDLGLGSFASAKGTYEAYAKSRGKETLEALSDLRQSVLAESHKIAERTNNLAKALWKDLAIAASPFVLKVFADTGKITDDSISAIFAYVAASFLFFAFVSQVYLNWRYFRTQSKARKNWNRPLLNILSKKELDEFVDAPINSSIKDYAFMAVVVGLIYTMLIAVLICFGNSNLNNASDKLETQPAKAEMEIVEAQKSKDLEVDTQDIELPVESPDE